MNCLEFESQVEILARGALLEARTRAAAEAHGESCGTCAARLADERALSVGLCALAAGMKTAEAPPRVEAALVASFRTRAASLPEESSEAVAASNVVPMSGHTPARQWSWAKTIAVASMAAAASLALFMLVRPDASQRVPARSVMIVEPPNNSTGGPPAPTVAQSGSHESVETGGQTLAGSEPEVLTPRPTYVVPQARAANVTYRGNRPSRPAQAADARAQEVATEFIPLVHAGQYAPAEEGHLVRVEVPRSALVSFGLPVNAEAPGGNVKADVLMGQDGIARAIRFVR